MGYTKAFGDKFTMMAAKRFKTRPQSVTKEQRLVVKRDYHAKKTSEAKSDGQS